MSKASDRIRVWRERPDIFVREVFGVIPDAWQDEILQAFPANQRIALVACKGPGKLQPKSMVLDTPTGKRCWGDLKKGDLVFAADGSPTEIKETYENGIVALYRVTFDDGSSTLCGGEHLWKVRGRTERRHGKWSVLTTEDIIKRGVREKNGKWSGRQFEIPQQGAVQYSRAFQPLSPYVLGVWLGDGAKNSGRYAGIDNEVAEAICERGYEIGPRPNGIDATIHGIQGHLRWLGVLHLGSHERFVPESYKHASIFQRKEVLGALMDTDGCIGDDGHMEFDSTSKRLADDVIWLVRSLGGVAFIKKAVKKPFYYGKNRERIVGRDCYRVTVKLPFNPFKIHKKSIRWKSPDNKSKQRYLTRYIDRIEHESQEDSMCIEIAHPSACYLANDFIVTHNTAIEAWLAWNFLLTRPYPKIAATSITGDNLADNLWTEMAKWQQKSPLLKATFTWTKTRIFANDHPETWWMSARPWAKSADPVSIGNTLAGLHADYILFLLDESGGMPDAILAAAEAALSSCIEGHIVQAGNPTNLDGPLYRAATIERRLWLVKHITADPDDPQRTPRVSVEWAKQQIEKYGRENPFVLVNVFGKFPPSSLNALIGVDEVTDAMKRDYKLHDFQDAARILGVDVALFGDDASVVFPRQGIQSFTPMIFRNIDGTQGANHVARKWKEWDVDAAFVDNTGGFGSSWCDNLRRIGFSPIGVHFAEKPVDGKYFNKRAEMMFEAVQWIRNGGALPPNRPELLAALTQTTYTFKSDKLIIEPKDVIKEKLGYSPDEMDAFILTFAAPVERAARIPPSMTTHQSSYNALSKQHIRQDFQSNHQSDYQPLRRK